MKPDIIFIDTNIFEENNFLKGKLINSLLDLSKNEQIKIVMPILIKDEIKNRFRKRTTEASTYFKGFRKQITVLNNIKEYYKYFEKVNVEKTIQEFNSILENRLKEAKVTLIDYPKDIDVSTIFKSFFNQEKPFGSGQKKDEFPDAFAIKILESWCLANNINKIKVLTKDNDWKGYKNTLFEFINIQESVDKYLREYYKYKHITELCQETYKDEFDNLKLEIKSEIRSILEDDGTYLEAIDYWEIDGIEISSLTVELKNTYLTNSIKDHYISISSTAYVSFEVEVSHIDENSGYYDPEDKCWYDQEYTTTTFGNSQSLNIELEFIIPQAGDDAAHIDIKEIEEIEIEIVNT